MPIRQVNEETICTLSELCSENKIFGGWGERKKSLFLGCLYLHGKCIQNNRRRDKL